MEGVRKGGRERREGLGRRGWLVQRGGAWQRRASEQGVREGGKKGEKRGQRMGGSEGESGGRSRKGLDKRSMGGCQKLLLISERDNEVKGPPPGRFEPHYSSREVCTN